MKDPEMTPLRKAVVEALGWKEADAASLSLPSLRDLVRPVAPHLAEQLTAIIAEGNYIRSKRRVRVRKAARCEGHEPEHHQPQGQTVYCDGTCRAHR